MKREPSGHPQLWSPTYTLYCITEAVQAVVGNIVVGGALTCCALLHSICDLKAAQMNGEFSLYEFEQDHNTIEVIKNVSCVKGEGTVDHSTVTR